MKVVSVVGTRPQTIKLNMILRNLWRFPDIEHMFVYSGQHYSGELSGIFWTSLELPNADVYLNIGEKSGGDPCKQNAFVDKMAQIYKDIKPDFILVYGDCNTTWLAAEAGYLLNIPVGHIEAGCRIGENTIEEKNRILTDHVSTLHFCPTESCQKLLRGEGLYKTAYLTGDILYDSYLYYQHLSIKPPYEGNILLTIHRAENKNMSFIRPIFNEIEKLKKKVIFPVHPGTMKIIKDIPPPPNLYITKAINYFEIQAMLRNVEECWTDSGGLLREAYFAGVETRSLRNKTEWDYDIRTEKSFGEGQAARRILEIIQNYQNAKKTQESNRLY